MKKNGLLTTAIAVLAGIHIGFTVYKVTVKKQKQARKKGIHVPYGPYEAVAKRPLDFLLAMAALILLSPVLVVTGVLVKLKLGSPVLFTQDRPGLDGKIFRLYKFRSMSDVRDEDGNLLPDSQRMTAFGTVLRSLSLDELPEMFNIVKGDMAIIGPRPLLIQYLPFYTEKEKHRHDVRPGLSGLAQTHGRNYVKWDKRLTYDIEYVDKITFLGDVKIILDTIFKIIKRDDVAVNTDVVETYLDIERSGQMTRV